MCLSIYDGWLGSSCVMPYVVAAARLKLFLSIVRNNLNLSNELIILEVLIGCDALFAESKFGPTSG